MALDCGVEGKAIERARGMSYREKKNIRQGGGSGMFFAFDVCAYWLKQAMLGEDL